MPEPLLHFAIPFSLSVPKLGFKKALLLSFIALLPDVDVLLRVHRSWTHSIIFLGALSGVFIVTIAMFKPKGLSFICLCMVSLLGHPVMDLFQTYTPILWPLVNSSLWLNIEAWITIPTQVIPSISTSLKGIPSEFTVFDQMGVPVVTSLGFIVSLILFSVSTFTRIWISRLEPELQKKSLANQDSP